MKFVFIGGRNVPSQGGIESYMLNLAKQLQDWGHDVWIICRGPENHEHCIEGIKVSQLYCNENSLSILFHNIKASWLLLRKREVVDVVNYQSIYFPILYEWMPKLLGITVCHTQHSFAQDNPKYGAFSRKIIGMIYWSSRFIFSPIITVSEHNKQLIKKRLRKNAKVIHCGVNLPDRFIETDILIKHGIEKGKYYLSIGRIDPIKNLDILIKAFLRHDQKDNVQLVISGNPNNRYGEYLKKIVEKDKRIIFTGAVQGDDKETLLSHCMAYCLVSTSEGFPIALLEAMSHGNKCICTSIPACIEVLPEEMGIWCKVRDEDDIYEKMVDIECKPNTYNEYGKNAKKRIEEQLTWDNIAAQYIVYINSIIKKNK